MTKKTLFPINIPELKKSAERFAEAGIPYNDNDYGKAIEKYLKDNLKEFYLFLVKNNELEEYIWFYSFKTSLYQQSFKFESDNKHNLYDYQANELAYKSIFNEIKNDATLTLLKEKNFMNLEIIIEEE